MGIKEFAGKVLEDKRTLALIIVLAILWRTYISLDGEIAFWESLCSGIALILLGWLLFAYFFDMSVKLKGWIISNRVYQGFGVCLCAINIFVLVYYGLRWYRLSFVETYPPLDFIFRDVRYVALVVFYCAVIWSAGYLKKMHEDYTALSERRTLLHIVSPLLFPGVKKLKEMSVRELLGSVIMDERTLIVIIGLTFLWRIFITLDRQIALWESACSGVAVIIMGWLFLAYICVMPGKVRGWPGLVRVYHGISTAVIAINIYVFVYYAMRWYGLAGIGGVTEAYVPLDFVFADISYFALVIFYCASIALSKYLKRAHDGYSLLSAEVSKA
ncbi:MAG: hypothetical protein U9O85_05070 [Euryarchaeota archaeon]|nr:hypothetical protein [Euryarchaeota archaeon]